jgi:hypothetical protein
MREDTYTTKTLNIAAFLYAAGLQLINTTKVNGEVFFSFVPKDRAEQLVESYFAGTATISPRDLFARLNDLRDLIFSGGKNG